MMNEAVNVRRNRLIEEIRSGERTKDVLPNSAFPFETERQAVYFSRARKNMKSDMAHATMDCANHTDDLEILHRIRRGNGYGHE